MLPEIITLNQIRLEEDRTYGDMAHAIGIKGESTVYRLMRGINQPIDRNLFKIRKYLASRQPAYNQYRRKKAGA